MTELRESLLFELRSSVLELSKVCPVDDCNPEDCPLFALRQMEPEQRLEWLRALSQEDLSYLAVYHHVCMRLKTGKQCFSPHA